LEIHGLSRILAPPPKVEVLELPLYSRRVVTR